MNSIKTHTADFLKRQAKNLKKEKGIPHHVALDVVAQQTGYANWQHFLNSQSTHALLNENHAAPVTASGILRCPVCARTKIAVDAVMTRAGLPPVLSMEWLLVEQHSDGRSPSGIAQTWGTDSDMRCMSCNFEGTGSQFGFTGEDVYLNHGPETMGLMPTVQLLPTEYIRYKCKTCGSMSYTAAANAPTEEGKLFLHCECGDQQPYDENEVERVQLQSSPEIRAAMGLN